MTKFENQNKRLVISQTKGTFQKWESKQEFQSNAGKSIRITRGINYELPTTGKIANFLSGSQAGDKIRQGIRQAAKTVKQNLESI